MQRRRPCTCHGVGHGKSIQGDKSVVISTENKRCASGLILFFFFLHVWDVLEDEGLVELGVEVLPVDLGLVLGLLVRKEINLK